MLSNIGETKKTKIFKFSCKYYIFKCEKFETRPEVPTTNMIFIQTINTNIWDYSFEPNIGQASPVFQKKGLNLTQFPIIIFLQTYFS